MFISPIRSYMMQLFSCGRSNIKMLDMRSIRNSALQPTTERNLRVRNATNLHGILRLLIAFFHKMCEYKINIRFEYSNEIFFRLLIELSRSRLKTRIQTSAVTMLYFNLFHSWHAANRSVTVTPNINGTNSGSHLIHTRMLICIFAAKIAVNAPMKVSPS